MPNNKKGNRRSNGEGCVTEYKLATSPKPYYQVELRRHTIAWGKSYTKTFKTRTDEDGNRFIREKDARRAVESLRILADKWEEGLHTSDPMTRKKKEDTTLFDLWQIYQNTKLGKTSRSNKNHMKHAIKLCKKYYDIPWIKLEVMDFQTIIDSATDTYDCKRKTKNLLTALARIAIEHGITDYNRVSPTTLPECERKKKDFFSEEELKELYNRYYGDGTNGYPLLDINDKYACAEILIMSTTGMRPGELIKVKPENINFKKLLISNAGIKTPRGKERFIPIVTDVAEIVKDYCTPVNRFAQYSETTNRKRIQSFLAKIGMRYRVPSAGRKTFSTTNAMHYVDEEINQTAMGHVPGSKVTEEHYIERKAEFVQREIEKSFQLSEKSRVVEAKVDYLFETLRKKYKTETLLAILERISTMREDEILRKLL